MSDRCICCNPGHSGTELCAPHALETDRELASDFDLIDDPDAPRHLGWAAFKRAMRGRAYGREALNSAWEWFRAGWEGP